MRRIAGTGLIVIASAMLMPVPAAAQADLYIRDTPADTGVEPNPNPGPMWVSEDIWVRTSPDPDYRPLPFDPEAPVWTPAAHQSPEYRDPQYGIPNYVYVRVRNRGSAASSGNETLQLYWAKASTGLAWPASWVDNYGPVCGSNRLLGAEITKPRKNAASATAAERTALRDAFVQAATDPAFTFLAGYSYWTKQQHIHRFSPEHANPAFLPWHREFVNRLEVLLQEADPRVKLMYWQWTTDPENSAGTNLFTPGFMGTSGRGTGGTTMGAVLSPAMDPIAADSPNPVVRHLSAGLPTAQADATTLARLNYVDTDAAQNFSNRLEINPNHNTQHGYIGGASGSMAAAVSSTRDPFFFLLHGKVDELWARWQRANTARLESATAYGTAATNPVLVAPQHPWDGVSNSGPAIDPWTVAGGYIVSKDYFDRSVVSPPFYDTAPLTIPALAPGQAVILEIPWYPPNPAHYSCLGDMNHFCLLGRIQPGITTPEVASVSSNVRANNNLGWKNIQIVDNFSGALALTSMLVANDTDAPMQVAILLHEATDRYVRLAQQVEAVHVGLPAGIFRRLAKDGGWERQFVRSDIGRGQRKRGVTGVPRDTVFLRMREAKATLDTLTLQPGERFPLHLVFQVKPDYQPSKDLLLFDVVQQQVGARDAQVGGVRVQLDLAALQLVKERSHWRHALDKAPRDWTSPSFDDAKWSLAPAPLGFGTGLDALAGVAPGTRTAYFRKRFEVQDPRFLRDLTLRLRVDDGAIVHLNGREVHRMNLPEGKVGDATPALKPVTGAAEKAFYPVRLPVAMLQAGSNVIAVQVHQHEDKQADLIFDAALLANRAERSEAPSVRIALDEVLVRAGKPMTLGVDAVDPNGQVRKLTLFVDDQPVDAVDAATGAFAWTPRPGIQRLRAVAEDSEGLTATEHAVVTGVANLPPKVRVQAGPGAAPGTVVLSADAVDDDGTVREVEFFLAENERFDAEMVSVGTLGAAPFEVTVQVPEGGHRLVTVRATDDGGEVGVASTHLHGEEAHGATSTH